MAEIRWQVTRTAPTLSHNDLHIWRAALEQSDQLVEHLRTLLSTDEQDRAARFYFAKDRRHFVVARGILRTLLGQYLGIPASAISFCYNNYGKPALDELGLPVPHNTLRFNLSHSHQLALYAFSYEREIGIDVEHMRPLSISECEMLAEHSFSSSERACLRALSGEIKREAFFACWTRKEAYIKARGRGLAIELDQFDVSLTPGEPAILLASREDPEAVAHWSLRDLPVASEYAGAVMVEGDDWSASYWQWSPI